MDAHSRLPACAERRKPMQPRMGYIQRQASSETRVSDTLKKRVARTPGVDLGAGGNAVMRTDLLASCCVARPTKLG